MKLVAAIVFMCYGGHCMNFDVEIEQRACKYGYFHGRYMGIDSTFGVKCK